MSIFDNIGNTISGGLKSYTGLVGKGINDVFGGAGKELGYIGNQIYNKIGNPNVGVQAKTPQQNIPAKTNTIASNQTSTLPKAQPGNLAVGNINNGVNPNASTQGVTGGSQGTPIGNTTAGTNPNFSGVTSDGSYGTGNPTTPTVPATSTPTQPQTSPQGGTQSPYTNNGLYGQLISQLQNTATNGSPQVNQAQSNLQNFQTQYANATANNQSTPIPLEFQQGRQQVLANQYNSALPAYQGAVNTAVTSQGQQLGALNNAATLAGPQSQFGVLTDPVTGQPISGGQNSSPQSAAFQGGQIQGAQTAGQNATQMQVANTAAQGIQGTIQQYLQNNPTLNPTDSTFANSIAQWAQGQQLGDPKYQTLANYLNEYISTLAPILGVGGDTTNLKTQIAQSFVNAQASGKSISQVLSDIGNLATNKLQNIISAGSGGSQVAGGTPQGTTPTSFGTSW